MTSPPAPGPFDPAGVEFRRVSPRLVTARLISGGITAAVPFLAGAVLAIIFSPWFWLLAAVPAALFVWAVLLVPRQVRAIGYAERDDDLLVRKGILFRQLVVVPYGRMQYVDVGAGPLDRKLDIAKVQLHTASAATDATIPGLPPEEAARLRDRLSARGEARLAGL
ncbi:membrane-flanked domain protein [Xylanimonas cellulosilytica DSM 15894]|uniref:Membrane-flanked domain protein n=1 Tax=Xylanimonas cellulosilytica (strain DSM 15894 / JCM 12276 / CECT 5975 / KCTC 9989 / LMG 20990 / NBRC 107835 / XIL07) TaxID=446471 RepID=D1BZ89_XYLCX|nr:PH domain-containing protein [Xylanimonas cellulosilytica]ACZ31986.1 membrane-flanked domain protein [Xylanimonas cellulosilytica DSM 15894]